MHKWRSGENDIPELINVRDFGEEVRIGRTDAMEWMTEAGHRAEIYGQGENIRSYARHSFLVRHCTSFGIENTSAFDIQK